MKDKEAETEGLKLRLDEYEHGGTVLGGEKVDFILTEDQVSKMVGDISDKVMAELGREDPLKIKREVQLLGKKFERRFATVDSSLNELKSTAPKYQIPKVVLTPKETIMVPFSY